MVDSNENKYFTLNYCHNEVDAQNLINTYTRSPKLLKISIKLYLTLNLQLSDSLLYIKIELNRYCTFIARLVELYILQVLNDGIGI